jgi:hypothetical protein
MAFDEGLAERIRVVLDDVPEVREQRMFGGLAFLVAGHMACGVVGDELMLRLGEQGADAARPQASSRKPRSTAGSDGRCATSRPSRQRRDNAEVGCPAHARSQRGSGPSDGPDCCSPMPPTLSPARLLWPRSSHVVAGGVAIAADEIQSSAGTRSAPSPLLELWRTSSAAASIGSVDPGVR